jgi:hypothetical protein
VSEKVITLNGTAGMWDVPGIRDRKTVANRTDTVLYDKWVKACLLIDIAIPDCSNVTQKRVKKPASKKTWSSEVSRMRKVRTKIVPVTIGALATIM